MIVCLVFVRQRVIFRGFARNQTVFVNTVNSDISGIHNRLDSLRNIYTAFLENPEIVNVPLRNCKANDIQRFCIHNQLNLQCMSFFLAGIVSFLFFFGRSISHSVASIKTTSISRSSINAFLDGRLNLLLFIRDSSAQRMLSYTVLFDTP